MSATSIDWSASPVPDVNDPDLAPYWQAAREGRLVVRHCVACDRLLWPPRPTCGDCGSLIHEWREVSPRGQLFTYTVVGHTTLPVFRDLTPYVVGVVEIEDAPGVRMVGRLLDGPDALRIGIPLVADFQQVTNDVTLPVWRSVETDGS